MSGIACMCASDDCALFGCRRVREALDARRSIAGSTHGPFSNLCNCRGPQPGMPRCPCQMRGVIKRDGRWIQAEVDLGPALLAGEPGRAAT